MKIIMLYRPNSEQAGRAEDFAADYNRLHPGAIELLNADSQAGNDKASIYDVTSYPAILALREDGSAAQIWQGDQLPMMSEIDAYALA